ncbi:MAG: DNA mismatch repair endonuclease MutL [Vicinamibacterales bacterium]
MPVISRLPPELANQIAAGEVVERPASVVKELCENAIDAEARRIRVDMELGGKRLIRVEDDGRGMDAEDAELALERHATSKIRRAEDLAAIGTLGFRGEALPSIASVSRLTLRSRARGSAAGTEVRVNGGVVSSVRAVGTPEGTIIEVGDLFYNLPARRKFLKADSAEAAQVSRLVTQLALVYPEVGFRLASNGRTLFDVPPVSDIGARFFQLYGDRPELVEVRKDAAGVRIHGFVAPLGEQGPIRGPQNIFVNRRIVRDKTLAHAITAAYSVATIKERSPEVHLFIEVQPDRVDVNVHPTKAEVRFLEQSVVHEVVRRAIGDALGESPAPVLRLQAPVAPSEADAGVSLLPGVLHGLAGFRRRDDDAWREESSEVGPQRVGTAERPGAAALPSWEPPAEPGRPRPEAPIGASALARQAIVDAVRPMTLLGQFRHTYIIAADAEGLCIIDQHVAHERVLYEQVMARLTEGALPSQRLLHPLLIELAPAQREALTAHAGELQRLGFDVEDFGGGHVRVTAVPPLVDLAEAEAAVRALANDLEGLERTTRLEEALKLLAATTACHAAVKANQPLTIEKMAHILEALRQTAYSSVCPHGRPVVLRLTRREIERTFQRI